MTAAPRQSADAKAQVALDALNRLDPVMPRAEQVAALKQALTDKHFLVVSRAATLAGDRLLHELVTSLLTAYARFLQDPIKRDPRCKAKGAIARALVALECQDTAFFQDGICYRQLEPVWGGRADSATDLRCSCAMGLANSGHGRAVAELASLLNDPEAEVRCGAARAISCGNPFEAEAVLRLKISIGDEDPQVLGECFVALLAVQPEHSLKLVAAYLTAKDDAAQEAAALALGESRLPEALGPLQQAWEELVTLEARSALVRAAALHRSEAAFDWLLSIIESGPEPLANAACDALAVYERNTKLIERVSAAKARRND